MSESEHPTSPQQVGDDPNEKRRDLRVPLRVIRVEGSDHRKSEVFFGYASNVSKSGLFIQTAAPKDVGTKVKLKFALPPVKEPVFCEAEVKWTQSYVGKGSSPGMGLRFLEISPEALASIEKFVSATESPS